MNLPVGYPAIDGSRKWQSFGAGSEKSHRTRGGEFLRASVGIAPISFWQSGGPDMQKPGRANAASEHELPQMYELELMVSGHWSPHGQRLHRAGIFKKWAIMPGYRRRNYRRLWGSKMWEATGGINCLAMICP